MIADACQELTCSTFEEVAAVCNEHSETTYIEENNILCINGSLARDQTSVSQIESFPLRKNLKVSLKSDGGDIDVAMDIVEHLEKFDYTAYVHGICASACAQFLFMGGKERVIGGKGAVGMHGGPFTDEQIDAMDRSESSKAVLRKTRDRFVAFYRDRQIDIRITYDFPEPLLEQLAEGKMVFWMPKEDDFKRYSISNIVYCGAEYYQ